MNFFTYTSYKPLYLSVAYLMGTLMLFHFGPINYTVANPVSFNLYMFFYIVMCCLGYMYGITKANFFTRITNEKLKKVNFWIISSIAFISALILNMNYAKLPSLFPSNLVDALSGNINILDVGLNYYEAHARAESYSGSKALNIGNFFLAWTKIVFLAYVIFEWKSLNRFRRIVAVVIVLIPVMSSLLVGTNKPIFDVIFVFIICFWLLIIRGSISFKQSWKPSLKAKVMVVLLVSTFLVMFSQSMSSRGASAGYIEYTSMNGDISVEIEDDTALKAFYLIATHYLVQGYYGFGLALNESFDSTFGFGHSKFLLRQASLFDEDIADRTYQAKISDNWHANRQWHSAFSEFANDVHFIGVGFVMWVLFFWMAVTWKLGAGYGFREALYFLPLHGILVFFLPANNQVFGFLDSLSAYVFLSLAICIRAKVSF